MKLLVNPLAWYLVAQFGGLFLLWRRAKGARALIGTLLILTGVVAIAATPAAGMTLEHALALSERATAVGAPEAIFVLAGGYLPGRTTDEDLLGSETEMRVLRGVTVWKQHPTARLVMSGAAPDFGGARDAERMAVLMANVAIGRGVPKSMIVLEPRSVNTQAHPIEALKLPGITSATPITIVTAGWHLRRARLEFCRHFSIVITSGTASSIAPFSPIDLVPTAGALGGTTTLVREFAGISWSAVRGLAGPASKC